MILSVPEGDDKPIKYPGIFQHAGAQLLNKVDVAPAFDFDMDRYTKTLDDLNPQAPRFAVSARKGEGMDASVRLAHRADRASKGVNRPPYGRA